MYSDIRQLTTQSLLPRFRMVANYGFRGQGNAGTYHNSTAEQCAKYCFIDTACLSFDIEDGTCFISHTDRYANARDFLPRVGSIYFEWQGTRIARTSTFLL